MSRAFRSDRTWSFPVPQHELWDRIATVENYPDDVALAAVVRRHAMVSASGAHWTCEVAPPLPYVVRFGIDFDDVDPGSLASTTVDGDIRGWARLDGPADRQRMRRPPVLRARAGQLTAPRGRPGRPTRGRVGPRLDPRPGPAAVRRAGRVRRLSRCFAVV